MVKYQKFISICFAEAKGQGAEFNTLEDSNKALQVFADLWSGNKTNISAFSENEAENYAHNQINVNL